MTTPGATMSAASEAALRNQPGHSGSSAAHKAGAMLWKARASGLLRPAIAVPMILLIAIVVGYDLDGAAGRLSGQWPVWIKEPSRFLTDYAKSGWILWASLAILLFGVMTQRISEGGALREFSHRTMISGGFIFASVASSGLTANVLKTAIGRNRPALYARSGLLEFEPFKGQFFHQSFPSGHATTAGALFVGLLILYPRFWRVFLTLGVTLASTRVFVGAHYPSDATAGFLLGGWFAFLTAFWFQDRGWWIERPERFVP